MFSRQQYSGFSPRTIPDCALWLDAADSNTIITATGVSQWNDKSGNGYNLTQATGASQPTQSGKYIVFSSDRYLNIPAASINNIGTWGLFFVFTPISSLNWIMFKTRSASTLGAMVSMTNYVSGSTNTAGVTNALYWKTTQTQTQQGGTATVLTLSTPYLIGITCDGTNIRIYINGTLVLTGSGTTAIPDNPTPLYFTMGAYLNTSGVIQNSGSTNFQMGEYLFYKASLTTSQRQQIEGYLAWKWGLQSNLTTGHPFKPNPTAMRIFQPVDISGCALWLDAADLNTFTPASPTNGTAISQWNDKSGNGRHATQSTSGNRPVYSSSDISVDTTTNPRFFDMTNMPSAPYDIFVVARPVSTTTDSRTLFRTATADPGMNPITLEAGSTRLGYYTSTTFAQFGTYTWAASTRNLLFARMNSTKTMNASLNGDISLTANTAAGTASDIILYMGALVLSGTVSQQWGNINEVIFYTTPLSTSERQQVEGYLAAKWGLSSSLPTTQPYYLLRALPSTPLFTPTSISNCGLWLDGLDPNNDNTLPTIGSSVATWFDKSGSGSNASATLGTTPTFASGGGITFSSGAYTTNYSASLTNESLFVVHNYTSTTGQLMLVATNLLGGRALDINADTRQLESSVYFVGFGAQSPANTTNSNVVALAEMITTSSNMAIWYNGTSYGTPTSQTFTAGRTSIIGGASNVTGQYFIGNMYEVIGYTRAISASERQQVEGYLAWKWGLQNSLPTTHPYYKFRP